MNYVGMTIKDLTVLHRLPPLKAHGPARYLCKCSCGEHCIRSSAYLCKAVRYGTGANCGCKNKNARSLLFGKRRKPGKGGDGPAEKSKKPLPG